MKIINKIKEKLKIYYKNIKKIFKKVYKYLKKNKYLFWLTLPFILMDLFTFIFGLSVSFFNYRLYAPVLFSLGWIVLFVGLSLSFKKKIGKWIYLFFNILFLVIFLVNNVYFSMTKTFFDFNLIQSASEGAPYMIDALKNCNLFVYVTFIIIIISLIYAFRRYPNTKKNNYKFLIIILCIFSALHILTPFTLGKSNDNLTWSNWRNARNIYNLFNDSNKSIKITGIYEYTVRNFYITYLKKASTLSDEDMDFLDSAFSEAENHKNKYTGMFKNKNLVIVQLEGMDNWIVNKNDTPTIYSMMNNGYNFTKHYSYYNGGGSTFNSEFAVNTGFITPLSYTKNAYSFNKNSFPNSLANLFKNENYSVNAFHMNTGEYYSRTANYINWGYDNYYGLQDMFDYTDESYQLDRELILNEKFNELLFPTEGNFVDYIITYSGHLPFTNKKGVCKQLYNMDNEKLLAENPNLYLEDVTMSEEDCVRRQAQETDYMMELLIENLKEKDLIDNTVIVVFTDHYLYTLEDETILDKYKNTSNNLINNTPFFIWSKDINKKSIKEVTSQLDILPTILNMFGIKYNTNNYIGKDALDPKYDGIVFFNDYSWYDGNVYVSGGEVTNNKKISSSKLEEKNTYISYITNKNDLALKYNYFKTTLKKSDD